MPKVYEVVYNTEGRECKSIWVKATTPTVASDYVTYHLHPRARIRDLNIHDKCPSDAALHDITGEENKLIRASDTPGENQSS